MIEVVIDSIRVSLMSQHRLVILKDTTGDRYLPIWIGPCEADAITIELQEVPSQRPLTHDLLKATIRELGGKVDHILINDLRNDVYYARIVVDVEGRKIEVDSRPSDAIALAVRVKTAIFVADTVMDKAAIEPDEDVEQEIPAPPPGEQLASDRLSAFVDFVDSLDLDDLEDSED
ncbi:MAG: bifunctional nuclease family protein [Burkholderiales bacterium]|nr:bifunctional nuclease family protein [Anaerolineae bacterium]